MERFEPTNYYDKDCQTAGPRLRAAFLDLQLQTAYPEGLIDPTAEQRQTAARVLGHVKRRLKLVGTQERDLIDLWGGFQRLPQEQEPADADRRAAERLNEDGAFVSEPAPHKHFAAALEQSGVDKMRQNKDL